MLAKAGNLNTKPSFSALCTVCAPRRVRHQCHRVKRCTIAFSALTEGNEWRANYAILRSTMLRQFGENTLDRQLEFVEKFGPELKMDDVLHLLTDTVQASIKGKLSGSLEQRNILLYELYSIVKPHIGTPSFAPHHVGQLLWSLGGVQGPIHAEWTDEFIDNISKIELENDRTKTFSTQDLANSITGLGNLVSSNSASLGVKQFAAKLITELNTRMEAPYVREGFTATDFSSLASSCATIYANEKESDWIQVGVLFDGIASEIRRQLANRHSRSPFNAREVVKFCRAYSQIGHKSDVCTAMLDVIATFVVTRVQQQHINALSNPEDIAGLLEVYADLQHNTVVIPELVAAIGQQLRLGAAQELERVAYIEEHPNVPSGVPSKVMSVATLASILKSHQRLRQRPDDMTLYALLPGLVREVGNARPEELVELLEAMSILRLNPGSSVVDLILARILDEAATQDQALCDRAKLLTQNF